jgi:16S rRNA (adenine1518-N6/adenine1519-N6)-dimethyltransferase
VLTKPKKSLGQNFLIDKNILQKIVNAVPINKGNEILEIGPGTGNLTDYLIKKNPKKIFVVEKDNNLAFLLDEKFKNKINIINDDILKISENLISKEKLIVFGNLPYNISTKILSKWIISINKNFWFSKLILMFQKEVADRIIAKISTSNYGRLSILANWKLDIKKIMNIGPNSFFPKPRVESSLLIFSPKNKFFKIKNPKNLEIITRVFFNQRRKMINKPFSQIFKNSDQIAKKLNIDLNLRPQNLSPDTYYKITKEYENLGS